ncbi:hypothetical protein [Paractinoplanes rishiriensis]|uniref:Uncharacterized protein n=1 Tax=Paractinoplanes rishiriensis TaxID=1050105 RepID=A0A919JUC5_9ACTN|nr:hypothetical protein [Actinoplanes rishiriensis]GIE95356.1 hypothetical protein Ari01nite_28210 [Actinoplanes rishiriensis]
MGDQGEVWTLRRFGDDGELLARLVVKDGAFPWLYARIEELDGFGAVRALLESYDDEGDSSYLAVRNAVALHYPDGARVPEFLLRVDGQEARWRWSDEPFDNDDDLDEEVDP